MPGPKKAANLDMRLLQLVRSMFSNIMWPGYSINEFVFLYGGTGLFQLNNSFGFKSGSESTRHHFH